jgi:putative oxidoreductase
MMVPPSEGLLPMIDQRTAPYAALLLRLTLGGLFLAHAGLKIFVFTPAGTAKFFASLGLPGPLAYLTMAIEVVGAVLLIAGIKTRAVAPVLALVLLGAIVTVHAANGFWFSAQGGGWEYPGFWAIALIVQALLGDGALAVKIGNGAAPVAALR